MTNFLLQVACLLLVCLLGVKSASGEVSKRNSKISAQGLKLINQVSSSVVEERIEAAAKLAKLPYDELANFEMRDTGCHESSESKVDKAARSRTLSGFDCRFLAEATYHLIAVFRRHATEEINPKSQHFCQGEVRNKKYNSKCPYLEKLRWLAYNQFDDTYSNNYGSIDVPSLAFDAIQKVVTLSPRTRSDLNAFRTLSAQSDEHIFTHTEIFVNDGFYSTPVIFYGLWKKLSSDPGGESLVQFQRILPFKLNRKTKSVEHALDALYLADVADLVHMSKTGVFVLRRDGGCCGDDTNKFHFIDVNQGFKSVGYVIIDSYNFPANTGTLNRLAYVAKEFKFPLAESEGSFQIGEKLYRFKVHKPN